MEPGQNRNIAALTLNFYVHIFFGAYMNIKYMDIAYEEAKKAFSINEVPVGAVIVYDNKIITKVSFNNNSYNKYRIDSFKG